MNSLQPYLAIWQRMDGVWVFWATQHNAIFAARECEEAAAAMAAWMEYALRRRREFNRHLSN